MSETRVQNLYVCRRVLINQTQAVWLVELVADFEDPGGGPLVPERVTRHRPHPTADCLPCDCR